ncbi:MAG: permease prefix domain 2-containing transporter [Kiloniellales bacterium]|nr:permease prefix domain 2-containing transporter [Kiloniellales bacterium]
MTAGSFQLLSAIRAKNLNRMYVHASHPDHDHEMAHRELNRISYTSVPNWREISETLERQAKNGDEAAARLLNEMNHQFDFVTASHHSTGEVNARAKPEPPRRAVVIMDFLLPHSTRENLIGDLEEEYRTKILPKYGVRVANRWYWWQALRSVLAVAGDRIRVWIGAAILTKAVGWLAQRMGL